MMYVLHIAAIIFFFPALIITIPAHCIIKAIEKNNRSAQLEKSESRTTTVEGSGFVDRNKPALAIAALVALLLVAALGV